jgi:hypothetical protein
MSVRGEIANGSTAKDESGLAPIGLTMNNGAISSEKAKIKVNALILFISSPSPFLFFDVTS